MPEVVEVPIELIRFQLTQAVQSRLQRLLDRCPLQQGVSLL